MKEKLAKVLGWLKGQTKVRWMKMLHTYMWIYGAYMLITSGIFIWQGYTTDPLYFRIGTERIFAALWFGLYWLMIAMNNRHIKLLRDWIELDKEMAKTSDKLIDAYRQENIALKAENNTLKALQPKT